MPDRDSNVNNNNNITEFRAGTKQLAIENGYPVITPEGTFVHDARAAWLVEAVEAWHTRTQEPRYDPGWFHASALGKTDEELIAAYKGEAAVEEHNAQTLRIFDLGNDRDRSWKRYLAEAGVTVRTSDPDQLRMKVNWLRLSGECDGLAVDPSGKLCIIEVKTINPFQFTKLMEPLPQHILQVHAYMGGLGVHQSIVLYEGKGDQKIKAFYVPMDDGAWSGIVDRLQRLRALVEGDNLSA